MSRTNKDSRRVKLKRYYEDRWHTEYEKFTYETSYRGWAGYEVEENGKTYTKTFWLKKAGVRPKKRKKVDTEDNWMTTPGWWVRLTMNRPQRREVHLWERKALFSDIEELIQPSRKVGHVYYW